jgi:hypothetical protein
VSVQPRENNAVAANGVVQQALRREVNEHISSLNNTFGVSGPEKIDVMCECVRANCEARITMSLAEYERVRRFPTHFFVKEGHEIATEGRVVSEASGYVIIEAGGRGGLYAVRADPRSSHRRRSEVDQ